MKILRVGVGALFGLAIAAGCSSVLPGSQTSSPHLSTPKSVSPGSIAAAPMAKTAILPASAMAVRPQSAIQGVNWTQISGSATFIAAAPDGSIWALSSSPAGADKNIWHYANGAWTNISGLASRLAVAPDGTLYAINSGGGTFSYNAGTWTALGGGASAVTAATDGSIYVLSNGNAAGSDQAIWHYKNGWSQVAGSGTSIAASWDTNGYTIPSGALAAGGLYILNSGGGIYYENPNQSFVQIPGGASAIAATTIGGVFVLGYPADPNGNSIYYYDLNTPGWNTQGGAGVSISTDSAHVYVIGAAGGIYSSPVTRVPVRPTPFATPAATPNVNSTCGSPNPQPGQQRCGVQRWHVKTLDDVNEGTINWTPSVQTVTYMDALPVPSGYNESCDTCRYAPSETQVYTIRALLLTRKHETGSSGDDDYHVGVADPDNTSKTMVMELPHSICIDACASGFGGFYDAGRNLLDTCFGAASSSFQAFPAGVVADITGVAFFDGIHGQTDVAPNGVELHPILHIEFVSGKPNVTGCTQGS